MKAIKIEIEETDRTDFLCVRCGGFRTEYAVRGSEHVGVHARCLREARALDSVRGEAVNSIRARLAQSTLEDEEADLRRALALSTD